MGRRGGWAAAFAAASTMAMAGLGGATGPAAAADAPYLDWPSLLPALPTAFTPDVEPDCADGSDACIDRTIVKMRNRLDATIPPCDHRAVFGLAYLRVTEDVRAGREAGIFRDPRWLNREDAVFARMYFDVYDAYAAGQRTGVPMAWQLAFDSERGRELSALGDFLMSMNAHINRDMPFVLAGIGLTRPDGTTRKPDHDAYNVRLSRLYAPVLAEVAARFDPTADDVQLGPVDDELAYAVLQSWREGVWRNAERLVNARTAGDRAQVAASIEATAVAVGTAIRSATTTSSAAQATRAAWCAQHGGQDPARVAAEQRQAAGAHQAAVRRHALAERRAAARRKAAAKRKALAKRRAAAARRRQPGR
jgi:hypothetical protein